MTNYIITNEAIDEAAEAIRVGIDRRSIWDLAKSALEAGAPFIRSQALEDAATYVEDCIKAGADDPISADATRNWLRARAMTEVAS